MRAGHVAQEAHGPRAGEAPVLRQDVVGVHGVVVRQVDEEFEAAHVRKLAVVLDAFQPVGQRHLVLVDEDFVRALYGRQQQQVALPVQDVDGDDGAGGGVVGVVVRPGFCRGARGGKTDGGTGGGGRVVAVKGFVGHAGADGAVTDDRHDVPPVLTE